MSTYPVTQLTLWLRAATPEQRERMAQLAGTTVNYAYQIAGCARGPRLSAGIAFGIEDATRVLHKETKGALPIVTARELATMCALVGLEG